MTETSQQLNIFKKRLLMTMIIMIWVNIKICNCKQTKAFTITLYHLWHTNHIKYMHVVLTCWCADIVLFYNPKLYIPIVFLVVYIVRVYHIRFQLMPSCASLGHCYTCSMYSPPSVPSFVVSLTSKSFQFSFSIYHSD